MSQGTDVARPSEAAHIDDGLTRCAWVGIQDREYTRYHDQEWGVPVTDDHALFEKLILEGFQSGLSWLTILKKRPSFRQAFDGFEAERIARYGEADVARLLADPGIVRNRLKVAAAIDNAKAYLALRAKRSLADLVWSVVEGRPVINQRTGMGDVPAQTDQSVALSKTLKQHGFRFVGPTTAYAFMQSCGLVNDHLIDCHRHAPCREMQSRFEAPRR